MASFYFDVFTFLIAEAQQLLSGRMSLWLLVEALAQRLKCHVLSTESICVSPQSRTASELAFLWPLRCWQGFVSSFANCVSLFCAQRVNTAEAFSVDISCHFILQSISFDFDTMRSEIEAGTNQIITHNHKNYYFFFYLGIK